MSSTSYGPPFPAAAYMLTLLGGILIVLYGVLEMVAAVVYPSVIESLIPGGSTLVIGLGAVGVVAGVIILVLAFRLKARPETARSSGLLIIVFSLISFAGGGGFLFVGLLMALVGGILAAVWNPPVALAPTYGPPGYGSPANPSVVSIPWVPSASPPLPPGAPQRFCSSCGSPNVASARFCARCGAPMT